MDGLFVIYGVVKRGKNRGKALGFPTANIEVSTGIQEGVYLSVTKLKKLEFPSLTFVGKAKTFGEDLFQAESYILNFDRDIYGEKIAIRLLKKIRDNLVFSSAEALKEQMEKDKKTAVIFFSGYKKVYNKSV
ncbi:MAG: riboflavin kinase [Candidatus Levybacteria bacterium]|nr:riboflavin kinase [Candidatus Levybacteria bacterium]